MNKAILISVLVLSGTFCQAQTFNEWFRQKETQKKYLREQIGALKVYQDFVQKGYAITKKGLQVVGSIKKGDFDLHLGFFRSLEQVNPNIGKYAKLADIVALQLRIVQVYKDISRLVKTSGQFNLKEIDYVVSVFGAVLEGCTSIIVSVTDVMVPTALEMTDGERLQRIDTLYESMQEAYTFTQMFGAEVRLLGLQRIKEEHDAQAIRALHDIKMK